MGMAEGTSLHHRCYHYLQIHRPHHQSLRQYLVIGPLAVVVILELLISFSDGTGRDKSDCAQAALS